MSKRHCSALAALTLCTLAVSASHAVVIDTFTRADGPDVTQSVGPTEYGFGLLERPLAPGAAIPNGSAQLTGTQLRLTGNSPVTTPTPTIANGIGGVYIPNYQAPDLTISARIQFDHAFTAPDGPGSAFLTNYFSFTLRSQASISITGNLVANDLGLVDVQIVPNGDIVVREARTAGVALTGVTPTTGNNNYFTQSNTATRVRLTTAGALARLASVNGQPLDANGNGFIDGSEAFDFKVVLAGTSLTSFINDTQTAVYTLQRTTGAVDNFIGLSKNRRSSADTAAVADILVDNLDISPIPEPASLSLVGIAGLALSRRRRTVD